MDWNTVDLVVFDLDGTLYDQRPVRRRMAGEIAREVLATGSLRVPRSIATYRRLREAAADQPGVAIEPYGTTAQRCGISAGEVRQLIAEWIERRPLPHLRRYRRSGVSAVFDGLRASRRVIAVLSDYPTDEKLKALDLRADLAVSALDHDVARLKPDPAGLEKILRVTNTAPARALVIGDRDDRDGEVARRIGVRSLILTARGRRREGTFRSYTDPLFAPVIAAGPQSPAETRQTVGLVRAARL